MRKSLDQILNGTARLIIGFQGLFMDSSRIMYGKFLLHPVDKYPCIVC